MGKCLNGRPKARYAHLVITPDYRLHCPCDDPMSALAPLSPAQYQLLVADELRPKPVLLPHPPSVESLAADAVRQLRAGLEASIAARLTSGSELVRSLERRRRDESLPPPLPPIDAPPRGGPAPRQATEAPRRGLPLPPRLAAL